MKKTRSLLLVLALVSFGLYGCQTSCGEHESPVLWADGITATSASSVTYQTTAVDGQWLHFPSYRSFRLPHHFGTKDFKIEAFIATTDHPVAQGATKIPDEFVLGNGSIATITELTKDELVITNGSCENGYYLFVRLTKTVP